MPSYVSHAIMGEKVLDILKGEDLLPIDINDNVIKTSSLGVDLAHYSKVKFISHDENTQSFFLNMISNIKERRLMDDRDVLAVLYGHVAHFYMDKEIHPYIKYLEGGIKDNLILTAHRFLEGYFDYYLLDKIKHVDGYSFNVVNYALNYNFDSKNVKELLNNTYQKTYGIKNIIKSYKFTITMLRCLEKLIKSKLIGSKDNLKKLVNYEKFVSNNLIIVDLLPNKYNDIWYHEYRDEIINDSLLDLYFKSILKCIDAIEDINKVLYKDKSIDILSKVFKNESYITGVEKRMVLK
mgnify:CR=1